MTSEIQATAEGDATPCGWFEGPHGAFRANPAFKMEWPPQSLTWQVPVYLHAQPQPKGMPTDKQLHQIFFMQKRPGDFGGRADQQTIEACVRMMRAALAAQSPAAGAGPGFDECVASGQSCSYGPHGPKGEMQCRYCGKEQTHVQPKGTVDLDAALREIWRECHKLKGTTDGRRHAEAHSLASWVMAKVSSLRGSLSADPAQAPAPAPELSEHFDELKATLEGAHSIMESLSAIERRVGPVGSHARGYTHKITKALRHLAELRTALAPSPAVAHEPLTQEQIDQIVVNDAWDSDSDPSESFGAWCARFARAIEAAHRIGTFDVPVQGIENA